MDRTETQADVLLSHFEFKEIMEWCTIDQEEVLTLMIDNGWIEIPPFLEMGEEDDEQDEYPCRAEIQEA